jgi:predicted nucleic acid-binding protein
MIAVADASPLIGLAKASRLRLLYRLYGNILLPPQVYDDVVTLGGRRAGAVAVANAVKGGWMEIAAIKQKRHVPPQFAGLGEGEAIALAIERKADVLLLDDRAARNYCTRAGLRWISTGGVLLDAYHEGAVRRVQPILDRMQAKNFGIWNAAEILRQTGEAT